MGWGNSGSIDNSQDLTHNTSISGTPFTLHYNKHYDSLDVNISEDPSVEYLYSYFIPKRLIDNSSRTYTLINDEDEMSILSNRIRKGCICYFAKNIDVKDWVINDLAILG